MFPMIKKSLFSAFLLGIAIFTGFSVFAQEVEVSITEIELEIVEIEEENENTVEDEGFMEVNSISSCEDIINTTDLTAYLGIYGFVEFDCFSQAVVEIVNEPVIIFPGDKIEDYIQVSIDGEVQSLSQIDGVLNFVIEEAGMGSITVFTPHYLPNWSGDEQPKKEHNLTVEIEWYNTCEEILSSTQLITLYLMHYNVNSLDCIVEPMDLTYIPNVTMPRGGMLSDYVELFLGEDSISAGDLIEFLILDESFSTANLGQFIVQVVMSHPDTRPVLAEFVVTIISVDTISEETNGGTTTGGGGGSSSSGSGTFVGGNTGGQVLGLFDDASSIDSGEVLGASDVSCPVFSNYLRRGNAGADVRVMQTFLNDTMNAGLEIDGMFGQHTEQAVRNFQLTHWDQVIAPWGSLSRPNTTGRWYMTTRAWAHEILGCREDAKTLSNGFLFSTASFVTQ